MKATGALKENIDRIYWLINTSPPEDIVPTLLISVKTEDLFAIIGFMIRRGVGGNKKSQRNLMFFYCYQAFAILNSKVDALEHLREVTTNYRIPHSYTLPFLSQFRKAAIHVGQYTDNP